MGQGSAGGSARGRARGRARQGASNIQRTTMEAMDRLRPGTRARLSTRAAANRARLTASYANARVNRRRRPRAR